VKHVTPRLSGISIALEFRQRRIESLPLRRRRLVTADEVSLVQFRESGEQLRSFARRQFWKLCKNLGFTHGGNLLLRN
jgi:hypothetical protein